MKGDAASIARLLGGTREGAGYLCRCPVKGHGKGRGDKRPSLSVSDGRRAVVAHCFAGCKPKDVIAALAQLAAAPAALIETPFTKFASRPAPPKTKTTIELALRLWKAAIPVAGTPAETYLLSRGLPPTPPATIRFLRSYRYDSGRHFPCLIAAVQAPSREITAVQLTFLDPSGRRKADVVYPRRAIGPLADGLLRLAPAADHLGLAEGFETAWATSLSHDNTPVWAVLGADRYAGVVLPREVRRVTIYADHDPPGLAGALGFFEHHPELEEVWISHPAKIGQDFAGLYEEECRQRRSMLGGSGTLSTSDIATRFS